MPRPKKHSGLHDRQAEYHKTDKGKAAINKYEITEAAKERKRNWWNQNKRKNKRELFIQTYGEPEAAISHLIDREQLVLRQYFGLDDQPPLTFEAIAQSIRLSKETVRQIKIKAMEKLIPIHKPDKS